MGFSLAAPILCLWCILPVSVRSVETIAQFYHHLKAYLYNIAYPVQPDGLSVNMLIIGILIYFEINQPFCLDALLSLVSKDLVSLDLLILVSGICYDNRCVWFVL